MPESMCRRPCLPVPASTDFPWSTHLRSLVSPQSPLLLLSLSFTLTLTLTLTYPCFYSQSPGIPRIFATIWDRISLSFTSWHAKLMCRQWFYDNLRYHQLNFPSVLITFESRFGESLHATKDPFNAFSENRKALAVYLSVTGSTDTMTERLFQIWWYKTEASWG